MDAIIKDKWVTALRSGAYQQGRKALRTTADGKDSYCCLGVLCDIVAPEGWTAYVIDSKDHWQHDDQGDVPSGRLLDYIGLRSRRLMEKLVTMNDTDQASFETIAQWIETNLEGN